MADLLHNTPKARRWLEGHIYNTSSFQILNPSTQHWFSTSTRSMVGYVSQGAVCLSAGPPVGPQSARASAAAEFEDEAKRRHAQVLWVGLNPKERAQLGGGLNGARRAALCLGAQPIWDPALWEKTLASRASLRAQINRAKNKGVEVSETGIDGLYSHAGYRECLESWLKSRALQPMGFLVHADVFSHGCSGRRLWVARQHGEILGFLVASPVTERDGYTVEALFRRPDAVNGTAEYLIDVCMKAFAAQGCRFLSMGLVPLSRHAKDFLAENPFGFRFLFSWARAHGNRFYRFRGLESFREKLQPCEWEPLYLVCSECRFSYRSFKALLTAVLGCRLEMALMRAFCRALLQECKWILQGLERFRLR